MISDFIDEKNGFLACSQEEYDLAKQSNPNIWMQTRCFLEYSESKEGYWTSEKLMEQMEKAVEIAEEMMAGSLSGCLITAAAMLQWLMIYLM